MRGDFDNRSSFFLLMRYHYEKPENYTSKYASIYFCDHPIYSRATLYFKEGRGLCVIQQRYDPITKHTWWSEIDPWLVDDLYLRNGFDELFDNYAGECLNGLYPTMSVRQVMWRLRMKPVTREPWETLFDHTPF